MAPTFEQTLVTAQEITKGDILLNSKGVYGFGKFTSYMAYPKEYPWKLMAQKIKNQFENWDENDEIQLIPEKTPQAKQTYTKENPFFLCGVNWKPQLVEGRKTDYISSMETYSKYAPYYPLTYTATFKPGKIYFFAVFGNLLGIQISERRQDIIYLSSSLPKDLYSACTTQYAHIKPFFSKSKEVSVGNVDRISALFFRNGKEIYTVLTEHFISQKEEVEIKNHIQNTLLPLETKNKLLNNKAWDTLFGRY